MELYKNGIPVYEYTPTYGGKNIVISIDSSKSNTAIFVWDEYGFPLDDYEIAGGGSDVNVYQLCWDTRKQLESLFKDARVVIVGIEDIITKNEKGYKGLDIHQSRSKITAVFDNLIFFFQTYHNIMPRLINNQAWKSHVLPEEFRKRTHDKGSKDWCQAIGNRWANRKDDVTDAYCIGLYIFMTENIKAYYPIDSTEPTTRLYEYGLFPSNFKVTEGAKNFLIKNTDALRHNIETVVNKINLEQVGVIKVPMSMLSLDDIYSSNVVFDSVHKFNLDDEEVLVVVYRKS